MIGVSSSIYFILTHLKTDAFYSAGAIECLLAMVMSGADFIDHWCGWGLVNFLWKITANYFIFIVSQNKVWSSVARTLAMIEGNINWKKYCINVDLDNNLFSTHHFLNYRLCVMLNFDKRLFCRCSLSLLLGIIISKKEVGTSMGQGAVGIYKHFKCWTADNPFFELIITIKKRWLSGATSLSKLQQLKKKK